MHGSQKLLDLFEDIYDAALEPARWTDVVVSINGFVGGQACGLISKDAISKFGVTHYYCGADPYFIQLYSETYSKFDPLAVLPPLGKVVGIPDLVRYDEYRRGRFCQEWLRPQGAIDIANVVLDNSKPNCPILLTFLSGKRMVDDDMRRRISLIAPHARRALLINQAIDRRQSESATFADTLDGLNAGIFLIDASHRIVHANAAGHNILRADDFLRSIGGHLVARDAQANKRLRDIVAPDGTSATAATDMAVPLTAHDGELYVARVFPLASLVRRGSGMETKAVTALFVRKVELDSQSGGQLLARTFELTPTELRVLLSIVEIGGVPETAEILGVAESTVKTHLHRIYAKTGSSRQADLVKLAAGYSSPLTH